MVIKKIPGPKRVKLSHSSKVDLGGKEQDENDNEAVGSVDSGEEGIEEVIKISDSNDNSSDGDGGDDSDDECVSGDEAVRKAFVASSARRPNYPTARKLCKALHDCQSIGGTFAFNELYKSAPNPGLVISLGQVHELLRLPLSREEVEAVVEEADQTQDETGVIKIGAENVEFRNPCWGGWVEEVLEKTKDRLGIDGGPVCPKVELEFEGVRIYPFDREGEKGFEIGDGEDGEGGGVLEITLPGEFHGGVVTMKYLDEEEVVEINGREKFDTMVNAWYRDVTYEPTPVSYGYKVTLVYRIEIRSMTVYSAANQATPPHLTRAIKAIKKSSKPVALVLEDKYSEDDKMKLDSFTGHDKVVVHHLTEAVERVGGLAVYSGELVTAYTRDRNDIDQEPRDWEGTLDRYDFTDRYVDIAPLEFTVQNMVHIGGVITDIGKKAARWTGPILSLGRRLRNFEPEREETILNSKRKVENGGEGQGAWETTRYYRCRCIFIHQTPIKPSMYDLQSRSLPWKSVRSHLQCLLPDSGFDYPKIAAIWKTTLVACISSDSMGDADVSNAGVFLAKTLPGLAHSRDSLAKMVKHLFQSADGVLSHQPVSYYKDLGRECRKGQKRYFRMIKLFSSVVSKLFVSALCLLFKEIPPKNDLQSRTEARFFLTEHDVEDIRTVFMVLDWETNMMGVLIDLMFDLNPSENLRRALDHDIKTNLLPDSVGLQRWLSLSARCHESIINGIKKRIPQLVELTGLFNPMPNKYHQVIGYNDPALADTYSSYQGKLVAELTSYFEVLRDLDHPDSAELVVKFLDATTALGTLDWGTNEVFSKLVAAVYQLPETSAIIQTQDAAVKKYALAFQVAVVKYNPCKHPEGEAVFSLDTRPQCSKATCGLCPGLNEFLIDPTERKFQVKSRHGEKRHFTEVKRDLKTNRKWDGRLEVGSSLEDSQLVLSVEKIDPSPEASRELLEVFTSALEARRELLGLVGVGVDEMGQPVGEPVFRWNTAAVGGSAKGRQGKRRGVKRKASD
ncbi:hypothetical protein TWF730_009185 [Orbilia blumenaviensis]|uniref:Uncharacterized protein n=1 Tax=Orbilia blumenaviensis TaxID=1796055 RepID=A0AAV9UXK2_9PEZI